MVFVEYLLSLRASAHTGVAIPRLDGECTDKRPKTWVPAIFGGNRYLVPFNRGIATTSVRTGLAMTESFGAKPLNTNLRSGEGGADFMEYS